jgi:hypothetical protein
MILKQCPVSKRSVVQILARRVSEDVFATPSSLTLRVSKDAALEVVGR